MKGCKGAVNGKHHSTGVRLAYTVADEELMNTNAKGVFYTIAHHVLGEG